MYHLSILNKMIHLSVFNLCVFHMIGKTFFLYMHILLKTRFASVNNVKVETKIHF